MQKAIEEYFLSCEPKPMLNDDGEAITDTKGRVVWTKGKHITLTGISKAIGFTRQSFWNYEQKDEFFDIITHAKMTVEEYAESQLYERDGARGAEFALSRMYGWLDPQKDKELNIREKETDARIEHMNKSVTIDYDLLRQIVATNMESLNDTHPQRDIREFEDKAIRSIQPKPTSVPQEGKK